MATSRADRSKANGAPPIVELRDIVKRFGSVIALNGVTMKVHAGEVMCLLGDNGAGKSTLIKTLSGVHQPTEGEILIDGQPAGMRSPRDALDRGIATVYQDLAMIPLMSITRNFFMGREPGRGKGPLGGFNARRQRTGWPAPRWAGSASTCAIPARRSARSGGERQCVAIARAVHFGARVLILDEPTSALGVKQASVVLRYVAQARARGLGVIFITHNVHHAYPVGDAFTLLNRGRTYGTFQKSAVSREEVLNMMAGGKELNELSAELAEFSRTDAVAGARERAIAEELHREAESLHGH